jgi:hypothetical protein
LIHGVSRTIPSARHVADAGRCWRTVFNCLSRVVYTVAGDLSNRCYNAIRKMVKVHNIEEKPLCTPPTLVNVSNFFFCLNHFVFDGRCNRILRKV